MNTHTVKAASFVTILAVCATTAYVYWTPRRKRVPRSQLPPDMSTWRRAGDDSSCYKDPWPLLSPLMNEYGYDIWTRDDFIPGSRHYCASDPPTCSLGRHFPRKTSLPQSHMMSLQVTNGLVCAARHKKGFDVAIKTICAGGQGQSQLRILRKLATGADAMRPTNHVLPMFEEIHLDDIVFGVFPYLTTTLDNSLFCTELCTAGDMINVMLQMLEATIFIHDRLIAHQDLFINNFLCEYLPCSLAERHAMPPRVFLIDFESAVDFPADSRPEDRLVDSHFFGDTFTRAKAPETLRKGVPFDPFALDIWQLGYRLAMYGTRFTAIDNIILEMGKDDPKARPSARDVFERIREVMRSIPPEDLDVQPVDWELVQNGYYDES
ncbi:kinase-like domain-containing protein [Favolaschia claudopus]|uniref:Kinase-like domain-containing protein n=1 Tax=Favolaschia claudopus TaxID=2862362 RepID=A0AAW0BTT0_9AGAR